MFGNNKNDKKPIIQASGYNGSERILVIGQKRLGLCCICLQKM